MNTLSRNLFSVILSVAALQLATPAWADDDPPARVGRLSYLSGDVSFRAADQEEWMPATLNYPVIGGDSLWTESAARTEVRVGSAAVRLDNETELQIANLDDRDLQLRLTQGALNLHLTDNDDGFSYEVLTPRGTVSLLSAGDYHIDAGTTIDPTRITVLEGSAQLAAAGSDITLQSGDSAVVSGTDPVSYAIEDAESTSFDKWAQARNEQDTSTETVRYVSTQTTGYEDLDRYGHWRNESNYGPLWYPDNLPADWAPYRYGHWATIKPWGSTWVDEEPWGFAPFHYGRWANVEGRWGWAPGGAAERPVFAPALVAFIAAVALGTDRHDERDDVGWFPLAPGEIYRPSYRSSDTYVRNINVTRINNTTINNINNIDVTRIKYVNRRNPAAVTVVRHDTFRNADRVAPARFKMDAQALSLAPIQASAPKIEPRLISLQKGHTPRTARIQGLPLARGEVHAKPIPLTKKQVSAQSREKNRHAIGEDKRKLDSPVTRSDLPKQDPGQSRPSFVTGGTLPDKDKHESRPAKSFPGLSRQPTTVPSLNISEGKKSPVRPGNDNTDPTPDKHPQIRSDRKEQLPPQAVQSAEQGHTDSEKPEQLGQGKRELVQAKDAAPLMHKDAAPPAGKPGGEVRKEKKPEESAAVRQVRDAKPPAAARQPAPAAPRRPDINAAQAGQNRSQAVHPDKDKNKGKDKDKDNDKGKREEGHTR